MINPIPGTTRTKNDGGYDADSGLDILVPVGTEVYAAADGTVIYSEEGHTPWDKPPDTPNSVSVRLATPFVYRGVTYYETWYTHLSRLAGLKPGDAVKEGKTVIGYTGIGNSVPHLHFGIIVDHAQTQTMPQKDIADIIWPSQATKAPKLFKDSEGTYTIVLPSGAQYTKVELQK